jgi:hypothetical protein
MHEGRYDERRKVFDLVLRLALLLSSEGTTDAHQPKLMAIRAPQLDFGFYAPPQWRNIITGPFDLLFRQNEKSKTHPRTTRISIQPPNPTTTTTHPHTQGARIENYVFVVSSKLALQSCER